MSKPSDSRKERQGSQLEALEVDDDPDSGQQLRRVISSSSFLAHEEAGELERIQRRERRNATIKYLMLLCACTLSLGSHWTGNILGPIKHRIGGSESAFSSLVTSSQLVNTISPLVSGLLVPKFGAARCGLFATGIIVFGQSIVCWEERNGGQSEENVVGMITGLFIFGIGIAPLAVVQESIIIANARKSTGKSIAVGLMLGKAASFAAAYFAEPLSNISPRAPFLVALGLSIFSFLMCVAYAQLEKALPKGTPDKDGYVAHGPVKLLRPAEIASFGDRFYIYLVVCALVGTWMTTSHLAASLLQTLYGATPADAASVASIIPLASALLYPIIGWAVDKRPSMLSVLFISVIGCLCTSFLNLLYFAPALPMILAFLPAAAIGCGPLLMVIVVPRLVGRKHIPTALGIHKAIENSGGVIVQSAASYFLATPDSTPIEKAHAVLRLLLTLGVIQLVTVICWWSLIIRRGRHEGTGYRSIPEEEATVGTAAEPVERPRVGEVDDDEEEYAVGKVETRRGYYALRVGALLIFSSWIVFFVNLPD